jgi:adenine-specific DNA-methyltransferase
MTDNKIETYGIRYLGSKSKILPLIIEVISNLKLDGNKIIDVFTGTTRVAQALKMHGYDVTTSDLSWASEAYSNAFVCNNGSVEHLQKYIDELNELTPKADWLTNHYCDVAAKAHPSTNIKVWKRKNGMKADAIRDHIETLDVKHWEKMYLISCLIFALDKLDNTVGLQQAYLKGWKSDRVDKDLKLSLLPSISGTTGKHIVGDALKINYEPADVAYLDPPYTAADYSTYYHIWDSITRWDKPPVSLKTNRRQDRVKSSDKADKSMQSPWYYKKKALKATKDLIERLPVKYCVFSYSDEGLISYDEMEELCKKYKSYKFHQQAHNRHVMSKIGAGGDKAENADKKKNIEYVIVIEK